MSSHVMEERTSDGESNKQKCSHDELTTANSEHSHEDMLEDLSEEGKVRAVEGLLSSYLEGSKPSQDEQGLLDRIAEEKKVNEQAFKSHWEEDDVEEILDMTEIEKDPAKKILWAAENSQLDTVRELLEQDPNLVHSVDEDLYTPLHRASYNGHEELCKLLITSGAVIEARTTDGWTPLHCACRWNQVRVASLLLQLGCDVNCLTNGKQTPLHLAASNIEAKEVLQVLLMNRWIDPSIVNDGHDTAYEVCKRSGNLYHLFELTLDHLQPRKKVTSKS